jgi:ribonuclease G
MAITSAVANRNGEYRLTNLPRGAYEISVPQMGLRTARYAQQNVAVDAGKTLTLNIMLMSNNIGILGDDEAFLIRVNPKVAHELTDEDSGLTELEDETGKRFHFEGGDALAIDTFELVEQGTRAAIEERALPFKVGEEVLVKIDEPHMYNDADAVARIDSYIVSITGGGRYVGQRKLVRIEEVERSAAIASLLGGDSSNGAGAADEGESKLDSSAPSRKRSRGRRGGQGRSRANQGSKDDD